MFGVDSDSTRGTAVRDGKRRQEQTTRDRNDAEIAYHRKHDDH